MCVPVDPVTAIMGAVSLGSQLMGTMQSNKAAAQVIKARNEAAAADYEKQRVHQKNADEVMATSEQKFTRGQQDAMRAQNEAKLLAGNTPSSGIADNGEYTATGSAPTEVKSEIARMISDALSAGKETARSSANFGSYGQTQFGNQIDLKDSAQQIGQIGDLSAGDTAVMGVRMNAAQNAGNAAARRADLFNGIGDIAGAFALSGLGKGGSSNTGSGVNLKTVNNPAIGSAPGVRLNNPNIGKGIRLY